MASCGYLCPQCEGNGFMENGEPCNWCQIKYENNIISEEEWIKSVHEGTCCADRNDD